MFQQLRANALAASALAIALTAMSVAIVGLPHNSVGGKQIKKGAVHKGDLHKHAVTASKLGTGVLRMEGSASNAGFSGSIPSSTPEFTLSSTQITTATAGRIFGFARGVHSTTCSAGRAQVGIYVDGVPLLGSGAPMESSTDTAINVWGVTAHSVPAGTHSLRLRVDCTSGNETGTGGQGDVALGSFVLRD